MRGGTPPPSSSITLTVVNDGSGGYTAAYQVGTGTWTAFTPNGTHTYTFNLSGNSKYGVAVKCNTPPGGKTVYVIQATNAELANPKITCSLPTPSTVTYTLTVNVTHVPNIASGDGVYVSGQGFFFGGTVSQSGGNYTATINFSAQPGTQDLVLSVVDATSPNPLNFKAAKVLRNVSISSGGSSNYTFVSGDALPIANASMTLPAGLSPVVSEIYYVSGDNKGQGMVGHASGAATANFPYRPVSGFASGDRYVGWARGSDPSQTLERILGFTGGPITLNLPSPWPAGSLTVSNQAHPTVSGLNYLNPDLKAYMIGLSKRLS